jgi:non-ribosomal peptide synthetase component F
MDAFAYPDVPFELLVRALAAGHDGHHFPIYQTMFSYQDGRQRVRRWGDLEHEMIPLLQEGIGEDIGLWLLDQSDGMVGGLCYNADILDHGSVELLARRLLDAFEATGAAGAAERNLGDLPLPAAETDALARWNATAAPFDRTSTVDRWLAARVASRLDAIALRHGARNTTHRELHAAADAVAVALRHAGVGAGDRVGVCLGRGIEMVAALLGTWRAGAAYVPFEADLPEARLRVMIEEAGVRCVLVDGLGAAAMQPLPVRALDVAAAVASRAQPGAPAAAAATAEMPAYVIFTSG